MQSSHIDEEKPNLPPTPPQEFSGRNPSEKVEGPSVLPLLWESFKVRLKRLSLTGFSLYSLRKRSASQSDASVFLLLKSR